ncbi:MAG TPA: phospho-N-acetylmuramoyl-pentapeptide-transferase [Actinomycetales bacterium]|nr:phospho-N-acetylmuramoyl-pentapeptide-transferase [Actinomycetales bacterium]
MTQIIVAGVVAFVVSIFLTPVLILYFRRRGFGQEIRIEGPKSHLSKSGTPTMGGLAIVVAVWLAYVAAGLVGQFTVGGGGFTASGLLVLGLATGLAVVGTVDDGLKVFKRHNKGLGIVSKTVGQVAAALAFAVLVLGFRNSDGLTPASTSLSYIRDFVAVTFPVVVFLIFIVALVFVWSNAVNFTDGLDGLAAGSVAMVMGTYVIFSFWQFRYSCFSSNTEVDLSGCYQVRDPLDIAVLCSAALGACLGFLWWNAAPAKIFMGDTGSMFLGGLVAGVSVVSHTELLMVVVGALFIIEFVSVVIQVVAFRTTGRRPFRMTPIHHHFENGGWKETTVTIRFWLISAISCGLSIALFYGDWLANSTG